MSVEAKICGLSDANAVGAACSGGAKYIGFVFYKQSPRVVDAQTASLLIDQMPEGVTPVGLFVNPTDDEILRALKEARLGMIQLHGNETAVRVAAVRKLTRLPVIKAVGISTAADVAAAHGYEDVADILLLDAKGAKFDWGLLGAARFAKPWFLAGALNAMNIAESVAVTGARMIDVSSGVEDETGRKNPAKIRDFLALADRVETCY